MRKIVALLIISLAVVFSTQSIFAQTLTTMQQQSPNASSTAGRQENNLANLKQRADKMISDRLTSLQKLQTRVLADKRLTDSDKNSFANDITATINNLTALKAKIDGDADITTARLDTKTIITSYRIYAIYEPKIRLLLTIDNLQAADGTLNTLAIKIQTYLTQLKTQGRDTTVAQTALNDLTAQLVAISTLLTTDKTLLTNITVQTTDPQSLFTQVQKDLATVRSDFATVRSDIAQIRSSFKGMVPPKGAVSPTGATQSAQ